MTLVLWWITWLFLWFEPPHDKIYRMTMRPAKTQISLAPAQYDQSLRCALNGFLYTDSEDSDQTERMPRLIWVLVGRTCYFVGFVMMRLILLTQIKNVQLICCRCRKMGGANMKLHWRRAVLGLLCCFYLVSVQGWSGDAYWNGRYGDKGIDYTTS